MAFRYWLLFVIWCFGIGISVAYASDSLSSRFFYSGDGKISLNSTKTPAVFKGTYRTQDGGYDKQALAQVAKVFGCNSDPELISLRLIEFFDYLQDHFNGGTITIVSGYRSPSYNSNLRKNGALAAKASLHQYGMAADIKMSGVPSSKIWEYVRDLKYGGAGYYHGKNVHLDVGPARWWDETSSKVDTDISDDNKLIILVNNLDIYLPGETIVMDFARMTAWPIGVTPELILEKVDGKYSKMINPTGEDSKCRTMNSFEDMQNIRWTIPADLQDGRYRIRARFCDKTWEAMPDEITTDEFVILKTPKKAQEKRIPADKF